MTKLRIGYNEKLHEVVSLLSYMEFLLKMVEYITSIYILCAELL